MTEAEITARILELSQIKEPDQNGWNHLWLIQARQVVLLEEIVSLLRADSATPKPD